MIMDTRSIEEYDLDLFFLISVYPRDRSLSCLRTMRNRRDFFSDEGIEESGFSSIWASDDGDVSGFWHE